MRPSPAKHTMVRSTLAGVTSLSAATGINGLVHIAVIAVLARFLSPSDFGQVGLAAAYIGFWGLFSRFGVAAALIRQPTLSTPDLRAATTLAVALGAGTTMLVGATAPLAAQVLGSPAITNLIRALSLTFLIAGLGVVAEAILERDMKWRRITGINLGSSLLGQSAVATTLAVMGFGPWALVGSSLAQTTLRTALLLRAGPHPMRPLVAGPQFRNLFRFGRTFTLARVLNYAAQQGDNVVVGRFLGVEALGFYSRAFKLMMLPVTNFGLLLTRVLFPVLSRLDAEPERRRTAYLTGLASMSLVGAPVAAIMIVLAPEIVYLLLGSRWEPAILPLQILSLGLVLRIPNLMTYTIDGTPRAIGRRSAREGLYATAVVCGALVGSRWGPAGVAVGVLFGVLVNWTAGAVTARELTGAPIRDIMRVQLPGALLGLIAGVTSAGLRTALYAGHLPRAVVFGVTLVSTVSLVVGLAVVFPELCGKYGRAAVRLSATAFPSVAGLNRRFPWIEMLGRGLARRMDSVS